MKTALIVMLLSMASIASAAEIDGKVTQITVAADGSVNVAIDNSPNLVPIPTPAMASLLETAFIANKKVEILMIGNKVQAINLAK